MDLDNRATTFRIILRDRAGRITTAIDSVLAGAGIATVKIPPRLPRVNWVRRTIRPDRQNRTHRPHPDLR